MNGPNEQCDSKNVIHPFYSESTNISDDVCILSAFGTAARINVNALQHQQNSLPCHLGHQVNSGFDGGGGVGGGGGSGGEVAPRAGPRHSTVPITAPSGTRKDR